LAKLILAALVLVFLVWSTSVAFKGMGPGPDVVFDALLGDSSEVTDLDGFVRKGDAYDVQIRFMADDNWLATLRYKGFETTDCSHVREVINFSVMRLAAWPPWRPEELTDAVCYRRYGENEWSPNARDVLLADPDGGWVYFAGEGMEHNRAMPESDRVEFPEER
jgi:hypothetical protein